MSIGQIKPHQTLRHLKGKKMKKKNTEAYHVQVNKEQLELAKKLVNLPEVFRTLVEGIVKTKLCPACGAKINGDES